MSRWRTELILDCSPSGRAAPLATIPDGLLRHVGLDMVAHLERRVEMNVDAVMQRPGIVEAVIERGGHLLVDRKRHGEDRQHLKLGIFRVPLVDVVQVDLAIPARTASKRTDLQILEGVVAHERSEGLAHDLGRNSHSWSPFGSFAANARQHRPQQHCRELSPTYREGCIAKYGGKRIAKY